MICLNLNPQTILRQGHKIEKWNTITTLWTDTKIKKIMSA